LNPVSVVERSFQLKSIVVLEATSPVKFLESAGSCVLLVVEQE
jgi:hypothetical protein